MLRRQQHLSRVQGMRSNPRLSVLPNAVAGTDGTEGIVSVGGGMRSFTYYTSPSPQIISFANPGEGPGTSHFGEFEVDNYTSVSLASNVTVLDEIEGYYGATVLGGGHTITVRGAWVVGYTSSQAVTFDNVRMVILDAAYHGEGSGSSPYFNWAVFQGGTVLDITRTDSNGMWFSNLTFTGALDPSTGAYIFNRGSADINLSNVTPLDGDPIQAGQHWWRAFGSGTVHWPVYAP